MTSDESDDEPLSVLAAAKKLNPDKFAEETLPKNDVKPKKKKKKELSHKRISLTIKMNRKLNHTVSSQIIKRPMDVWLYMKDLNPTGPYSCLLCSEWFINRSKIIIHYVLNHKKDFCGICRYFVPDRKAWWAHVKFHTPWSCSQCVHNFESEPALRQHLSSAHKLVHCRLCHFRVSADDQYKTHLFQKHSVTNVSSIDEENLWQLDYEGSNKFLCLLCSKSNNLTSTFSNHYMGYHHFTLKCFTSIISGRDPPFLIDGAEVSPDFIESQLKGQMKFGYVDLDQQKPVIGEHEFETGNSDTNVDTNVLLSALIPEIKQEPTSETEEDVKNEMYVDGKISPEKDPNDITNTYTGDEDFDVTLTELIVLQKCYYEYVNQTLNNIDSKVVPTNSNVTYEDIKSDAVSEMTCDFCKTIHNSIHNLTLHMNRMHSIKSVPVYSCRVCATTFETQSELDNHTKTELGDFDDLWICQFCDKEFNNRENTRLHLTEHWEELQYENCFSPHVGFKCKFCSVLFWNETDRETHQLRAHFNKHKAEFYKCVTCSNVYGDKIWFTHHYLDKHCNDEMKKESIYLLKCCICCLVMSNVQEMRNHFETEHLEARKVYCSMGTCQYRPLSHRKSFKFHLRSVHNPTSRPERAAVSCTVCAKEFVSARACAAHMTQVHGPGKYKCKLCKEVLHTMDERKLHYLIRHPGRHPFECTECGKSFQYKSSLYMHKQEHSPNKQSYTCNYCGKVFMKKDSFREHVQIHEGPRHACSYCPMRFVQRSNMLRHERRHTGERPYACPHCSRTFADKGACTSHARRHSRDTSYSCLYCGQTFVQKSKLTYHIRKHTGENLETCTVCSKLFTSACALREHMKIHSKERETAKCPLCERVYQDERSVVRHLRTSHAQAHYSCPLCPKALTSASGLRHHVLTHSRTNTFQCKSCPKSYAVKKSIIKHLRRRHGLKGTEYNIREYFKRLDPRECELDLDEDVMTTIFGPPKKTTNEIVIGNYVTLANKSKFAKDTQNNEDDDEDEENDEQSDEEDDENDDAKDYATKNYNGIKVEVNKDSGGEEDLEPIDFVSVKIEPIDEDETTDRI